MLTPPRLTWTLRTSLVPANLIVSTNELHIQGHFAKAEFSRGYAPSMGKTNFTQD